MPGGYHYHFLCVLGHIYLSLYRKIVSVGISSTPNVSLTSLLGNIEQRVSVAQSYSDVNM